MTCAEFDTVVDDVARPDAFGRKSMPRMWFGRTCSSAKTACRAPCVSCSRNLFALGGSNAAGKEKQEFDKEWNNEEQDR